MNAGLFDPKDGRFAENIRKLPKDDSELRESMKHSGWIEHLPAFIDENDVVIVGHRRMKIAEELKIKPIIHKVKFGKGQDADTKRLQFAIASNTGGKDLTKHDRKRIAVQLYEQDNWTQQAIADAMNVSRETIRDDLLDLADSAKSKKQPKTPTNPRGSGRRKGNRPSKTTEETEIQILTLRQQGKTQEEVRKELNLDSVQPIKIAEAKDKARRDAQPEIDAKLLSMTAQEKLDTAIRQHTRKLDAEYEQRVQAECHQYLESVGLPHYLKKLERLERLITARKGVMDKTTYNKIRWCLHSDHVQDPALKRRYDEAFTIFNDLEKLLLSEKDSPSGFQPLPKTFADLQEQAAKFKAERSAAAKARAAGKTKVSIK
jgi:ParB-like chromosome segregation protein Spo0J